MRPAQLPLTPIAVLLALLCLRSRAAGFSFQNDLRNAEKYNLKFPLDLEALDDDNDLSKDVSTLAVIYETVPFYDGRPYTVTYSQKGSVVKNGQTWGSSVSLPSFSQAQRPVRPGYRAPSAQAQSAAKPASGARSPCAAAQQYPTPSNYNNAPATADTNAAAACPQSTTYGNAMAPSLPNPIAPAPAQAVSPANTNAAAPYLPQQATSPQSIHYGNAMAPSLPNAIAPAPAQAVSPANTNAAAPYLPQQATSPQSIHYGNAMAPAQTPSPANANVAVPYPPQQTQLPQSNYYGNAMPPSQPSPSNQPQGPSISNLLSLLSVLARSTSNQNTAGSSTASSQNQVSRIALPPAVAMLLSPALQASVTNAINRPGAAVLRAANLKIPPKPTLSSEKGAAPTLLTPPPPTPPPPAPTAAAVATPAVSNTATAQP